MRAGRQNLLDKFSFMGIITVKSGQIATRIGLPRSRTRARSEPQSRSGGRGPAPCTCIRFHFAAGQGVSRWLPVPAYFFNVTMPGPALGRNAINSGDVTLSLSDVPVFFERSGYVKL